MAASRGFAEPRHWMVLALFALASAGCGLREVSTGELSGMWVLTDQSRKDLGSEVGGAAATLRLDQSGTFSGRELPGSLLDGRAMSRSRFVTGDGMWKLTARGEGQEVQLVFDAIVDSSSDRVVPYGTQLHVWTGSSRILLFYFEGDPDEGRRIEFERAEPGASGD